MTPCEEHGCEHLETRCVICGRLANFIILPKQGEWISVKEQYPRNGQKVQIKTEHETIWEATCVFRGCSVDFLLQNYDGREDEMDSEGSIGCVTHWMPLPEPPKE